MPFEKIPVSNAVANCYIIKAGDALFMVDAGVNFLRSSLKKTLKNAGCKPGDLKMVIITHGDYDHTGNAAYLQKKYGAKIAIHRSETGVVEWGDMLSSRKTKQGIVFRMTLGVLKWLVFRKVKPDIFVGEGDDLSQYGLDGRVVHIPGHSIGSIGILTKEGDFFCGDLMTNSGKPEKNTLVDDTTEMDASIEKLKALGIKTVYPGHGKPFKMEEFFKYNPH